MNGSVERDNANNDDLEKKIDVSEVKDEMKKICVRREQIDTTGHITPAHGVNYSSTT